MANRQCETHPGRELESEHLGVVVNFGFFDQVDWPKVAYGLDVLRDCSMALSRSAVQLPQTICLLLEYDFHLA